jgi:hypothetical protein
MYRHRPYRIGFETTLQPHFGRENVQARVPSVKTREDLSKPILSAGVVDRRQPTHSGLEACSSLSTTAAWFSMGSYAVAHVDF